MYAREYRGLIPHGKIYQVRLYIHLSETRIVYAFSQYLYQLGRRFNPLPTMEAPTVSSKALAEAETCMKKMKHTESKLKALSEEANYPSIILEGEVNQFLDKIADMTFTIKAKIDVDKSGDDPFGVLAVSNLVYDLNLDGPVFGRRAERLRRQCMEYGDWLLRKISYFQDLCAHVRTIIAKPYEDADQSWLRELIAAANPDSRGGRVFHEPVVEVNDVSEPCLEGVWNAYTELRKVLTGTNKMVVDLLDTWGFSSRNTSRSNLLSSSRVNSRDNLLHMI